MKSLFTIQPDDELDKETVEQFCRLGIRETTRVEYKREFPNDLAKSVSSFANTQGGIILIGVAADSENKPVLPLTGMPFAGQPEERVYQVCANSIHPPILPNVWVVRFEDPSQEPSHRAIVVIRVQQGETAHAIDGRKGIYVRTGNLNNPFDERATVDRVIELLARRKEAAELGLKLASQSRARFAFFFEQYLKQTAVMDTHRPYAESLLRVTPVIRLRMAPVFPWEPILSLRDLRSVLRRIQAWRDVGPRFDPFPRGQSEQTVQDAIVRSRQTKILELAEFSQYGLVSFSYNDFQDANSILSNPSQPASGIDYLGVISNSLAMMCLAVLTHEAVGFYGLCDFSLTISGVKGRRLVEPFGDVVGYPCPDEEINFSLRLTPSELKNDLAEHYIALVTKFENAFGREVSDPWTKKLADMVAKSVKMNFRP